MKVLQKQNIPRKYRKKVGICVRMKKSSPFHTTLNSLLNWEVKLPQDWFLLIYNLITMKKKVPFYYLLFIQSQNWCKTCLSSVAFPSFPDTESWYNLDASNCWSCNYFLAEECHKMMSQSTRTLLLPRWQFLYTYFQYFLHTPSVAK